MSSKLENINRALGMIGANLITSLADNSNEARLMKLHYDAARDSTLESKEWTFATHRFMPSAAAEKPLFGWQFKYPIPTDIIRVLTCDRIGQIPANMIDPTLVTEYEQIDWIVEERHILANVDIIYARGIRRVVDENMFSPLFDYALSTRLGFINAYALTQSKTVVDTITLQHAAFLKEAGSRDAIQGRSRRIRNRSLLRVR